MKDIERLHKGLPFPFEAIDMHAHIGRYSHAIPDLSVASQVAVMDRLGVKSTTVSHMQCMSWDVTWGNDEVYKAMKEFPGRILGYASMFPKSKDFVAAEAKKRVKQGFTGFKFHNSNGFAYDDPAYEPAWELAEKHHLPMLYHTWGAPKVFEEIQNVALKVPSAYILMGHSTATKWDEYIAFARKVPNIRLELCTSSAPLGSIEYLAAGVGAERVVWGSDCNFYSMAQQFGRIIGCTLPEADKRKIAAENALAILADRK